MIPHIIHYCWFGGKDKPESFNRYLETWKKHFPDWKIIEWNEDNFDTDFSAYSRQAYLTGNYAHVSDVCRIYALNRYGGIYLDTDVEILRPFEMLLNLDSFVSLEGKLVGMAVIGAKPGTLWTEECLRYYRRTNFINIWGHAVRTPNTKIMTRKILPSLSPDLWPTILPTEFLSGLRDSSDKVMITDNTYAVHHFAGSWVRKGKTMKQRVKALGAGLRIRHLR